METRGEIEVAGRHHGGYVNLSDDQDEKSLRVTYGSDKYAKLRRIKAKYDPENLFRLNQNLKPSA